MTEMPMVATWDEFWARFDRALAALPDDIRGAAVDALRPELPETEPPPPTERAVLDTYGKGAGRVYYAVHESELLALEKTSSSLAGIATVLFTAGQPVGAVASLIASLVAWGWRFRRQRIQVTLEQALVLRALKPAGREGQRLDELLAELDDGARLIIGTSAELEAVLVSLAAVERTDGKGTSLVACKDDRWRTIDV